MQLAGLVEHPRREIVLVDGCLALGRVPRDEEPAIAQWNTAKRDCGLMEMPFELCGFLSSYARTKLSNPKPVVAFVPCCPFVACGIRLGIASRLRSDDDGHADEL